MGCYTLIAFRWLPETRPAGSAPAPGPGGASLGTGSLDAADPPAPDAPRRLRVFAAFLPLHAATHGLTFLWVTTLPIDAATGLALPTPVWGVLFGINGLLIVLFQLRIAGAGEGRSKPRVMALGVLLYAAGMGVVALLSPTIAVLGLAVTICLVTLGEMLIMPVVPAFVSDLSPATRRGTYQGIALAAGSIGAAAGPPLAGAVLDAAPGATALWAGSALLLLVIAGGFVALGRMADRLAPASGA